MNEEITLRQFLPEDSAALETIIRETWNYDQLCSPKTAARLAKVYLYSCLTNQTFTQVALYKGVPVGIIMGKNNSTHKCPVNLRLKQFFSVISLYISREGRNVSNIFKNVSTIDKELLQKSPLTYDGEVAFFAVSPRYRGKGIGKILFNSLLEYMRSENIHIIYLYTDTTCNYAFYEYQGMYRRCQKTHTFQIGPQQSQMTFFLYDHQIL
ncbi:MAG: GNAT family N-acetyltransferase [Eubacteriales bacterium]|nr:GNAT family N-acetyltransferase [Eubacteriales bacterium]